jgi:hypothetical protein
MSFHTKIWTAARSVAILFIIPAVLYCLSTAAYFAFFIGARLTHSVPVARAFDAAGALFLLPGRLVLHREPAYITFFPSVIVPVNTAAWFVMLCIALVLYNRFRGGAK